MPRRGLPSDAVAATVEPLRRALRRLDKLEQPDGAQLIRAVEQIAGIPAVVDAYLAGLTNITIGGTLNAGAGITSLGAAALDVSTLGGTRQTTWQHIATGRFGYAPSTLASKANLSESLPFTAEDVYATIPFVYEYIGQIAIRDDPENEFYDPDYKVPIEIGLMAEHLEARNMGIFVVRNEDGSPRTIDYAAFGAIANLVAVRDLDARLRSAGL